MTTPACNPSRPDPNLCPPTVLRDISTAKTPGDLAPPGVNQSWGPGMRQPPIKPWIDEFRVIEPKGFSGTPPQPPIQWNFADLVKNATPDVQKQLRDLYAELAKLLQPKMVVTPHGKYVVDTLPPDMVIRNIVYNLQQSKVSPENFYSELIAKLKGEIERLKNQRTKKEEENLDKALERVEEQRRREAELWERLDRWKSTQVPRGWIWLPRLVELPGPPFAIPPWRWALPKPVPA